MGSACVAPADCRAGKGARAQVRCCCAARRQRAWRSPAGTKRLGRWRRDVSWGGGTCRRAGNVKPSKPLPADHDPFVLTRLSDKQSGGVRSCGFCMRGSYPRASVPVSSATSLPCVHLFIALSAPFSPTRCLVLLEANAAREQVQFRNEARAFYTARGEVRLAQHPARPDDMTPVPAWVLSNNVVQYSYRGDNAVWC